MLLTVSAASSESFPTPTDLGFVLHKHPDKVQHFPLPVGQATVLYPDATAERCTAALILDIDPIELARSRFRRSRDAFALGQYVNDRPYAGSSLLAVALNAVFGTAMAGTCAARPDLVDAAVDLVVRLPTLPARSSGSESGTDLTQRLFGPLGWTVDAVPIPLDPTIPDWGDSDYVDVTLSGTHTVRDTLRHLYVLLPVLDDVKHYWVGQDEADKLLRLAGDWLSGHPESAEITSRYLAHRRELVASVADSLLGGDDLVDENESTHSVSTDRPLAARRRAAVVKALLENGARSVVDVGCGEGRLVAELLSHSEFTSIVGTDVSARELARAEKRLHVADMSDRARERLALHLSSATYHDVRLAGHDAIVLMEVIEHVDPDRLPALVRSVFAEAVPRFVIVTTPNAEYNVLYPGLARGGFRHPDHRFEFTRDDFATWVSDICSEHSWTATIDAIGDVDPDLGGPTQFALFRRQDITS